MIEEMEEEVIRNIEESAHREISEELRCFSSQPRYIVYYNKVLLVRHTDGCLPPHNVIDYATFALSVIDHYAGLR